jgi:hypothetical protein
MNFIAKKIERLIEEQENKLMQLRARELVVKVEKMQEGLNNLSMEERRVPTPEVVREEILH